MSCSCDFDDFYEVKAYRLGVSGSSDGIGIATIAHALNGLVKAAEADKEETERLTKDDARAN